MFHYTQQMSPSGISFLRKHYSSSYGLIWWLFRIAHVEPHLTFSTSRVAVWSQRTHHQEVHNLPNIPVGSSSRVVKHITFDF